MPKTSTIAAALVAVIAPTFAILAEGGDWSTDQVLAASALATLTVGFVAAVVEHVRKETPSRWVAVFGLLPPEVAALLVMLRVFEVTHFSAGTEGAVLAIVTGALAAFGVTVAQSKVYAPETIDAARASAHAGQGIGTPPVVPVELHPDTPAEMAGQSLVTVLVVCVFLLLVVLLVLGRV
jgi:uncharacterized membrane protein YjjB (DUF3815 family)